MALGTEDLRKDMATLRSARSGGECAMREKHIPRTLKMLESAVARVQKIGEQLEQRLDCVCINAPPQPGLGNGDAPRDGVGLSRHLETLAERLICIADKLESIDNRLEL